jgi:hypothetical protein
VSNMTIQCPSAMEDNEDALVFGVVGGTAERPQVAYLTTPQPLTQEIRAICSPATPAEVLRIATPCVRYRCIHFEAENCTLAQRIIQILPPVVDQIPACKLRPECRWWVQEGKAACLRCPQVVRTPSLVTDEHRKISDAQSVRDEASLGNSSSIER